MNTQLESRHGFTRPVFLATLMVAIAGCAFAWVSHQSNVRLRGELAQARAKAAELEAKQPDAAEFRKLQSKVREMAKLEEEAREVHKMRSEVTQFRQQKGEFEKLSAEIVPLRAAARELQVLRGQTNALAHQLRSLQQQNVQIRQQSVEAQRAAVMAGAVGDPARNSCIANMKQIDGATQQWALENKKIGTSPVELAGIVNYLRGKALPRCPGGGAYVLPPNVAGSPTCSVHGVIP